MTTTVCLTCENQPWVPPCCSLIPFHCLWKAELLLPHQAMPQSILGPHLALFPFVPVISKVFCVFGKVGTFSFSQTWVTHHTLPCTSSTSFPIFLPCPSLGWHFPPNAPRTVSCHLSLAVWKPSIAFSASRQEQPEGWAHLSSLSQCGGLQEAGTP